MGIIIGYLLFFIFCTAFLAGYAIAIITKGDDK